MNLKKVIILSGFTIVMMTTTGRIVFAEETAIAPANPVLITSDQQATPSTTLQKDSEMQWAWGEITNLDNQAKTVTLKYLDYETDQEKDLVLVVDEKTAFENIKDFNELKLKDTLSIDYIIGVDNKNIAKNISFEKPDVSASTSDLTPPAAQSETPVVNSSIAAKEVPATVELAPVPASVEPVPASVNSAPVSEPVESVPTVQGQNQ